jgi:DNA ligase-associated metallophosphoesterase
VTAAEALYSYQASSLPCGSCRLTVAGETVTLRASGALWLEAASTLIVADVHFEKGSAYAARGQMLPPFDTRETLRRLEAEAQATNAARIVFLGDAFHDGKAEARLEDGDREHLQRLGEQRQLVWIVGNHDAEGPKALPGEVIDDLAYGTLILRHEPADGPARGEVAGHLHPCARVVGRGGSVRRRCFVTDGERLILPAFGAYAGGLNVRDEAFAGLFVRAPIIVALGQAKCHAVGWRMLVGD